MFLSMPVLHKVYQINWRVMGKAYPHASMSVNR
jgi:hypothetical protein